MCIRDCLDIGHKDSEGSNALHLAIGAEQWEVCKLMIEASDVQALKSEVNLENKNALMLLTTKIKAFPNEGELKKIEQCILQKTGQKHNIHMMDQTLVDKSQKQQMELFRGSSCGFSFEPHDGGWACSGQNCSVKVYLGSGQIIANIGGPHYTK